MGLVAKAFWLSLFMVGCFTATAFSVEHNGALTGYHSHYTKPPVYPPVQPPVKPPIQPPLSPPAKQPVQPPVSPPTKPPVQPPVQPPGQHPKFKRSLIAVQGVVYCKACEHAKHETLSGAKPMKGATVRLLCKNGKYSVGSETKTDKKGYFLLLGPKTVTNYAFLGCRVYLIKSPNDSCSKPALLNGGRKGSLLKPVTSAVKAITVNNISYALFSVGPFAFNPVCPRQ